MHAVIPKKSPRCPSFKYFFIVGGGGFFRAILIRQKSINAAISRFVRIVPIKATALKRSDPVCSPINLIVRIVGGRL